MKIISPPFSLFRDSVSIYNTASVYEKTKRDIGGGKVSPHTPNLGTRVVIYTRHNVFIYAKKPPEIFFYKIQTPYKGVGYPPIHLLTASALSPFEYLGGVV